MSYGIFYNKQFVKLSDGRILPIVLRGSNNCTQRNRRGIWIRERNWHNLSWYTKPDVLIAPEELMRRIDEDIEEQIKNHTTGEWAEKEGTTRQIY